MNLYSVYMLVIIMQNIVEIKGENWETVYVLDGLASALSLELVPFVEMTAITNTKTVTGWQNFATVGASFRCI